MAQFVWLTPNLVKCHHTPSSALWSLTGVRQPLHSGLGWDNCLTLTPSQGNWPYAIWSVTADSSESPRHMTHSLVHICEQIHNKIYWKNSVWLCYLIGKIKEIDDFLTWFWTVRCLLYPGVLTCCNGVATTHLVCQLIIQTLFISAALHRCTVGHAQGVGRHWTNSFRNLPK